MEESNKSIELEHVGRYNEWYWNDKKFYNEGLKWD